MPHVSRDHSIHGAVFSTVTAGFCFDFPSLGSCRLQCRWHKTRFKSLLIELPSTSFAESLAVSYPYSLEQ